MSPSTNLYEDQQAVRITRPPPLKINKESQVIQKPAASKLRNNDPVIIYMHSPKILHIKPHDFMAVVQRLTGLSPSSSSSSSSSSRSDNNQDHVATKSHDDRDSKNHAIDMNNKKVISSSVSPTNFGHCSPKTTDYLRDIPLFMPNSEFFFCSPSRGFNNYRPESALIPSPNNGVLISPSLLIRGAGSLSD